MADVYDRERELLREIAPRVERSLPGVEVLALELQGRERFCVYVDHPKGVDHALCARVTDLLRDYLSEYTIDVSSPGSERPLRKPAHFAGAVGRRVALRTQRDVAGRRRFRGEVVESGERSVKVATGGDNPVDIPYDEIVRGNVIDERA